MSRSSLSMYALAAVPALALSGCRDQRAPTGPADGALSASVTPAEQSGRYIVVFGAERLSADFAQRVANLGGSVEAALDPIGVAAVTGLTEAAAVELAGEKGIAYVEPDVMMTLPDDSGEAADETASEALAPADATASPTTAQFYARQWNMRAVSADKAWEAGQLGSRDVVVAILDTGIDYLHPDLVGLVDLDRSISFAATDSDDAILAQRFPGRRPISDLRGHGTAVAVIVGSNATLLAGVNRDVTLLAVKIWNRFGQGPLSQLLSGIMYAADHGADVMSVSGTYDRDKSQNPGTVAAVERAVNYAFRKGALLVSIAGNDGADLDHNGDRVRLPCEAANAICVSGTAPTAAAGATGPWENVDAPAPYTAFGRSAVDVAAPAGRAVLPIPPTEFRTVWALCTTTRTEFTFPPCRTGQPVWKSFGTSFSATHTAGLAALLVAQLGHGNPALIRARILESADDLGEPGTDPFYGKGRINIARALGLIN